MKVLCLRCSRKDKARKLKQLQAELLTLEDDINAVAGRKALEAQQEDAALSAAAADGSEPGSNGYPAVLAGFPVPRMPSELLQMRLNGTLEENGDHQPVSPQSGALLAHEDVVLLLAWLRVHVLTYTKLSASYLTRTRAMRACMQNLVRCVSGRHARGSVRRDERVDERPVAAQHGGPREATRSRAAAARRQQRRSPAQRVRRSRRRISRGARGLAAGRQRGAAVPVRSTRLLCKPAV